MGPLGIGPVRPAGKLEANWYYPQKGMGPGEFEPFSCGRWLRMKRERAGPRGPGKGGERIAWVAASPNRHVRQRTPNRRGLTFFQTWKEETCPGRKIWVCQGTGRNNDGETRKSVRSVIDSFCME